MKCKFCLMRLFDPFKRDSYYRKPSPEREKDHNGDARLYFIKNAVNLYT